MLKICLLIVLALGIGLAQAKPSSSIHSKIYQVNLIVFKNRDSTNLNNQILGTHPHQPNTTNAIELGSMGESLNWKILPNSAFQLSTPLARIEKSRKYQVITYLAWKQPINSGHSAKAVHIIAGNNQELNGTIKLSLTNYLILSVDLVLMPPYITDTNIQNGNPSENSVNFSLNQTIRMRLGEIHYLDNPMYGVLVLVNRA